MAHDIDDSNTAVHSCVQEALPAACRIHASQRIELVLQTLVDKGAAGRVRSLPHIISLMSVRELRRSILEGAVASIGGVDQTLSQAAANALVAMVLTPDLCISGSGAAQPEGTISRLCIALGCWWRRAATECSLQ